jgi:hypothetical protein
MPRRHLAAFIFIGVGACVPCGAQSLQTKDAATRLAERKFQEAFVLATAELGESPSSFQLHYVAGSAACALGRYDIGIEHLLNAIRANSDGIKYEHREALENCIAEKHRPSATVLQKGGPAQGQVRAVEFPAGQSFSVSQSCGGEGGTETAGLKFIAGGSVQYARTGCGKQKFLTGNWRRTGAVISMEFPDTDPWGRSIRVGLSGTISNGTVKIFLPFSPQVLLKGQ